MTVISYPIPAYSNVPINSDFYKPRFAVISAITLGNATLVTTSAANTFYEGQQVRFVIPTEYQIYQLNSRQGVIFQIVSDTQFYVNIDSTGFNPFYAAGANNQPLVLPIGDVNSGAINQGRNNNQLYIDGSFINVSPNG